MIEQKSNARKWLVIAILLCLISMIGASFFQTSFNNVTIKDIRWETESGRKLSALLLKPDSATEMNPAPAIVVSHGWYNNREMQDLNYIEYSRRGYVVISIDMYGHGHSDLYQGPNGWDKNGTGMYDAVQLLASLPYVDRNKIGVSGHSNGARACNLSVFEDNKQAKPLISAVLLVGRDAEYSDPVTKEYWNIYGNRNTGIIAGQYDEFFFRTPLSDGSRTSPRDFLKQQNAQSFLHFGVNPGQLSQRSADTIYQQEIDGKKTLRVIYNPNEIHPWNHFSKSSVSSGIEFFQAALGVPTPIESTNQIWQFKTTFNALGLIGFAIFLVSFTKVMLFTPFFSSLRSKSPVEPTSSPTGKGILLFWGGMLLSTIFAALCYNPTLEFANTYRPGFMMQVGPAGISMWSAVAGIIIVIIMLLSYHFYDKKQPINPVTRGIKINNDQWLKTLILSAIVITSSYSIVFIADYFFKADFRLWVLTLRTFTPDKLLYALPYWPLFLTYYIASSISVNCFNYNQIGGKAWINTTILAFASILGPLVLVFIQYHALLVQGEVVWGRPNWPMGPLSGIWLFPILFILPLFTVISRKIYRITGNPYLPAIIYATIVTIMSSTNTLTAVVR